MRNRFLCLIIISLLFQLRSNAQISTNAGLTPPEDRWIFRTQYRIMGMENNEMRMNTQVIPFVIGYGISSNITLIARATYISKTYEAGNLNPRGLGDLYFLLKFKLLRKNTATYTFGIAPFLASNIPIGSKEVSNQIWNPEIGLNFSFRPRFISIDLSTYYTFIDASNKLSDKYRSKYNIDLSFSYKIPIKSQATQLLSPTLEFNYSNEIQANALLSNKEVLFVSPGISYINSSIAIEILYQHPTFQQKKDNDLQQTHRWIIGFKFLF